MKKRTAGEINEVLLDELQKMTGKTGNIKTLAVALQLSPAEYVDDTYKGFIHYRNILDFCVLFNVDMRKVFYKSETL